MRSTVNKATVVFCWMLGVAMVSGVGCSRNEGTPDANSGVAGSESTEDTSQDEGAAGEDAQELTFERLTNSVFTPELKQPDAAPQVQSVAVPPMDVQAAVWGATGRDDQGHVWFAVSPMDGVEKSAKLYEFDPASGSVTERGDVLSEARKAGVYVPGMQQAKIHTKIMQAGDGNLYFVSSDENPRDVAGRTNPKWGSHLWRLRLPEREWEHLEALEEGVLALGGGGNDLYGLAFPDHTLFHYDVASGELRKVKVGSVNGHISRNLLVDGQGRAYVPRLKTAGADAAEHTLVAFDRELTELGSHPIPFYQQAAEVQPASIADQFHGITGFTYLADGSIVFATHAGRLFRLIPDKSGAGKLDDLGWLHPDGKSYATSLFTVAGERYVYGLPMVVRNNNDDHDLVVFDLAERKPRIIDVKLPEVGGSSPLGSSLYGSNTRDGAGALVIVGAYGGSAGMQPVLLRVLWPADVPATGGP